MYEDKTLVCKECGKEFVFTAGEQEFYAERGFQNEPQRGPRSPRVFHRCLRGLRRRGSCSLRAQERPSCVLQRLLRQDEGAAGLICLIIALKRGLLAALVFCMK